MDTNSTAVLVVGGSLVGLSTALFLAWHNVPTVLIERHHGSSQHPRAIGYTPRTVELLREVGLGARIPQVPAGFRLRRVSVESLAGKWLDETLWTPGTPEQPKAQLPIIEYSPCTGASIAQDQLEPILREKAVELGAQLRLGTELIRFEQADNGVTAILREQNGREYTFQADYLVAADGSSSPVREKLGIGRTGRGHLGTVRSVLFRAPLDDYLQSGARQFEIDQPGLKAFLTTYGDGRWVLMFTDDVDRDEGAQKAAVSAAIGRSDIEVEIITTGRWELEALIADRFASGRVFIAGDAAHTLPPTRGGYGANTGIQDAHNLAWKLSAVLSGVSTSRLLDTYSAERQPVAWQRHQQTFARPDYAPYAADEAKKLPIIDDEAMEFGQLYRSSAVIGAGADLPPALRPDQWAGQPGTRVPHLWISKGGERLSTLDLFRRGWVLLAAGEQWVNAVAQTGRQLGIALECVQIGVDVAPDDPEALRSALGLGPGGASLVRPDGYVAWRSADLAEPLVPTLTNALGQVSCAVARTARSVAHARV